jgi:hypothetical protein
MAILQGTMSDGTLIPVQADSQGRLVCEGLPGPEGPQGPEGPPGPQGPEGPGIVLPANPRNGDVLAWDNGLIWVSGLIPTYPPASGNIVGVSSISGIVWSSRLTYSPANPTNAFDGNTSTFATRTAEGGGNLGQVGWSPFEPMTGNWRFYLTQNMNSGADPWNKMWINTNDGVSVSGNGWYNAGNITLTSMRFSSMVHDTSGVRTMGISAFEYNGEILVDGTNETILTFDSTLGFDKMPIGSTITQSDGQASGTIFDKDLTAKTITLTEWTGTWGPANTGLYVVGEVQAVYADPLKAHR